MLRKGLLCGGLEGGRDEGARATRLPWRELDFRLCAKEAPDSIPVQGKERGLELACCPKTRNFSVQKSPTGPDVAALADRISHNESGWGILSLMVLAAAPVPSLGPGTLGCLSPC